MSVRASLCCCCCCCFLRDSLLKVLIVLFTSWRNPRYLHCNPNLIPGSDKFVNYSSFLCAYHPPEFTNPWVPDGMSGCAVPCDRVNITVGKDPAHHLWPGQKGQRDQVSSYFGGYWYSTTKRSQCTGVREPGDGGTPPCTWKVTGPPKYVCFVCCLIFVSSFIVMMETLFKGC